MPGLVPGIHAAVRRERWREMPGTSPGMTEGAHSDTTESEGTGARCAPKTPARLRPIAKPDSNGLHPEMTRTGFPASQACTHSSVCGYMTVKVS